MVIADTSVLIVMDKLNLMEQMIAFFDGLVITEDVRQEFGQSLNPSIRVINPGSVETVRILRLQLDKGESSSIALGLEHENSLMLLDDLKARKVGKQLNMQIIGSLGLLTRLKANGIIPKVGPYLIELNKIGFRISPGIAEAFLKANGEELEIGF